jgi:hypothetical protein
VRTAGLGRGTKENTKALDLKSDQALKRGQCNGIPATDVTEGSREDVETCKLAEIILK